MKKHINDVYNLIEDWPLDDLERLQDEIDSLIDESCNDCGSRPHISACFTCKMD